MEVFERADNLKIHLPGRQYIGFYYWNPVQPRKNVTQDVPQYPMKAARERTVTDRHRNGPLCNAGLFRIHSAADRHVIPVFPPMRVRGAEALAWPLAGPESAGHCGG
ncbi:hypothetical protein SKAU_G00304430 [Synaphobranchus kaupii]|uniref:Uncharacterized protein n=1 Tax=Synaphobranchus kaupii TaxID=118154 RepID=A0A9Q1EWC3_SYNKA|nr:hypothetical protein SKAU_G00304430 [Synaphobranchus kaupii]